MAFSGFPRRVRFTPVPNPIFGLLLEQIDDLAELKCTLRAIWLLSQKRGYPRFLTLAEMEADRTLVVALATTGVRVETALARAVDRGTLVGVVADRQGQRDRLYALNTDADRNALARFADGTNDAGPLPRAIPWEGATERANIFSLYEDNIGMLSPILAEQLREAEAVYPASWIEDAFREAVSQNKRSWRYIERILERWEREGKSDGEPGRYPKKAGYY